MLSSDAEAGTSRSASRSHATTARGTVKIRNVAEGVVYHLTFDGDLGRLTGYQLKQHIESIAGIPPARQTLSVNGHLMANETVASSLGLRDGSVVVLETISAAPQQPVLQQQPAVRSATPAAHPAPVAEQHHHQANAPEAPLSHDETAELRQLEEEIMEIKRREAMLARRQRELQEESTRRSRRDVAVVHHYHGAAPTDAEVDTRSRSRPSVVPPQRPPVRGAPAPAPASVPLHRTGPSTATPHAAYYHDEGESDDHDIEVRVEEEASLSGAWLPSRSVDVDEMRLQQQDYVWKMEQVRFETERMTREREMRRQQQELEYQAALLDRERVELERRTMLERVEFEELQGQERVDLDIEAKYTPALLAYRGRADTSVDSGLLP
jgi:hypothetical protein